MRRPIAAVMHVALGIAACHCAWAQGPAITPRPEPKVHVYRPQTKTAVVIGVMGQVGAPDQYEFGDAPTLELALATARGVTPNASPMVRIVRGYRVWQSVDARVAAQDKLQSGDVVIVDRKPAQQSTPVVAPKDDGVQVALVGVTEHRPYIVKVLPERAHPKWILQMLGQQQSVPLRVIPPPNFRGDAASQLADGSVLIFDCRSIDVAQLPDNLPKIVPCSQPGTREQADIVGYGVHNAYEERAQPETPDRDDTSLIPLPPPEEFPPSPIAIPSPADRGLTAFAPAGGPGLKSAPISTVPFSGTTVIPARPSQFTESAPTPSSSAADAREPAWNQRADSATLPDVEDLDDEELSAGTNGAFSIWQMLSIVSSAALIVGLALALRASQQKLARQTKRSLSSQSSSTRQAALAEQPRSEVRSPIPSPHIPLQSFTATAPRSQLDRPAAVGASLEQRQRYFTQIVHHELPLVEEPLTLRPGIPLAIQPTAAAQTAPRAGQNQPAEGSAPKQFIDSPHSRLLSGPHQRSGAEAPVERALRQLQGDPS